MAIANRRASQHSQRAGRRSMVLPPLPTQPDRQSPKFALQLLTKTLQADTSLSGTGCAVTDNATGTEAIPDLFAVSSFPSSGLHIPPNQPRTIPQSDSADFSSHTQNSFPFSSTAKSNYNLVHIPAGSQHPASAFPCTGGDPWTSVGATGIRTLVIHQRQEVGSHALRPPVSDLSSQPLNSVYEGSSQQDVLSGMSTPATPSMDFNYFPQPSYDQGSSFGPLPDFDETHTHEMNDTNDPRPHDTTNYEITASPDISPTRARHSVPGLVGPNFICDWVDCGKPFRTHSQLTKHVKSHKKAHRCRFQDCSRFNTGFATTNDCDRHERSVHKFFAPGANIKVYKCAVPDCKKLADGEDKIWPRLDNFKQHCTRMHGDVNVDDIVAKSEIDVIIQPGGEYLSEMKQRVEHEQEVRASNVEEQLGQIHAVGSAEVTFAAHQDSADGHGTELSIPTQQQPLPRRQRRPSVSTTATSESRKRPRQPDDVRPRTPSFGQSSNADLNSHCVPVIQNPRFLSPTTPHRRSFGGQGLPQHMPGNPHLYNVQQTYPTPPSTQQHRAMPQSGMSQRMSRSVSHQGDDYRAGYNPRLNHQSFPPYPQYPPSFAYQEYDTVMQQSPDQMQPVDQHFQPFDASWRLTTQQSPMVFGNPQQRPYTIACDQFSPDLTPILPEAVTATTAPHSQVLVGINPAATMFTDDMTTTLPGSPHTPALDIPATVREPPTEVELNQEDSELIRFLRRLKNTEIQKALDTFEDQHRVPNSFTGSSSPTQSSEDPVKASSSTPSCNAVDAEIRERKPGHARSLSQASRVEASSDDNESIAPSETKATSRTGKGRGKKKAGNSISSSHHPPSATSSNGPASAKTPVADPDVLRNATVSAKARFLAGKSNYACDLCHKHIGRESELKKHRKRHFGLYSCVWDKCQSRSGSKSDWSRHEENKHGAATVGGWRCDGRHADPNLEVDDVAGEPSKCYKWWPVTMPQGTAPGNYEQVKAKFTQHLLETGAAQPDHPGYGDVSTLPTRQGANETVGQVMQRCWIPEASRGAFWCGFCDKIIQVEPDECTKIRSIPDQSDRDKEWRKHRLDHIETHFDIHGRGTGKTCAVYRELGGGGKMKMEMMDWFDLGLDRQVLVGVPVMAAPAAAVAITAPPAPLHSGAVSDDDAGPSEADSAQDDDGGVGEGVALAFALR